MSKTAPAHGSPDGFFGRPDEKGTAFFPDPDQARKDGGAGKRFPLADEIPRLSDLREQRGQAFFAEIAHRSDLCRESGQAASVVPALSPRDAGEDAIRAACGVGQDPPQKFDRLQNVAKV